MSSGLGNTHPALRHAWHPLCRSSEVTSSPQRFTLLNEHYVVYRTSTKIAVFLDRCPHRRAPLSLGSCEGDALRCAYHGWLFGDDGRCREIPALGTEARLPPRAHLDAPAGVAESHGMVFVAPEEPLTPLPDVTVARDPRFQKGDLPVVEVRASAGLLADNFLDVAHFPFVHAATFGADEAREVPPYDVVRDGFRFRASYEHEFANREDPEVLAGRRPLQQRRRLTYRYCAPFHLELAIEFLDAGGTNVIGFFLTPVSDDTVRIHTTLWRDDLGGSDARMADAVAFEVAILEEDLRVQSRYDVLELPLEATAEVHTRADKTTLLLRRVLADLVAHTAYVEVGTESLDSVEELVDVPRG